MRDIRFKSHTMCINFKIYFFNVTALIGVIANIIWIRIIWHTSIAILIIGEEIACEKEPENVHDNYAVRLVNQGLYICTIVSWSNLIQGNWTTWEPEE